MLFELPDILLSTTALVNVGVLWFVYQRDRENPANLFFSFFIAFIAFWALIILLFRLTSSISTALYLMKLSYVSALLLAFFFYKFSYLFPEKEEVGFIWEALPAMLAAFVAGYVLVPGTLALQILQHSWGKEVLLDPLGYALFAIPFLFFFLWGQIRLFIKSVRASGETRVRLAIIAITVTVVGFLACTTTWCFHRRFSKILGTSGAVLSSPLCSRSL